MPHPVGLFYPAVRFCSGDSLTTPDSLDRSQHTFTLMFSARSTAPRSEQQISIIVSQPDCWGVQLTQTIRVMAKAPAGLTGRVNFASVMALGYNLGFAETGAYQNAPVNSVIGPLNSAQQIAVALNLPPDGIDALLRSLPVASRSSLFYQDIVTTRQVLERMISRNCNCGPISNPWYAFTSGYQMALAEYASYQNADFRTVIQLLTWARQNASNSGLPINGFDYPLEQLNRGVPPANVYQYIAGLRAQLMQQANFWCNC